MDEEEVTGTSSTNNVCVLAGVAARWQCGCHLPLGLVPGAVVLSPIEPDIFAIIQPPLPVPTPAWLENTLGLTLALGCSVHVSLS